MLDPLYTPCNCEAAYQLDWSYSIFWHEMPSDSSWFEGLKQRCEPDHIRLLQHQFKSPNVSQFLISTKPKVPPLQIAQRVKGRLTHILRGQVSNALQRSYSLRSIGSTKRRTLDRYLQTQLDHHPMADPVIQERLKRFQIHNPSVDLSKPRHTTHAIFWNNLHIVLVNRSRGMERQDKIFQKIHDMIIDVRLAKNHLLSRAAILPDHIHLAIGCSLEESAEEVALSYMNNIAFVCGMKPIFSYSYYAGTFSEYDLGVIPL